jgi:thiol:disulfide interchange protein DsbC
MSIYNRNNSSVRKFAVGLCALLPLWCVTAEPSLMPSATTVTAAAAPSASAAVAVADPAALALRHSLQAKYPNTKFGTIVRTPMTGIWEVWMGGNVAYVTDEARHFLFGHLYDMQTQTDLTVGKQDLINAQQAASKPKIDFKDLPLADAIKTVRGTGARKLAVFTDPDCGYCRLLEEQLAKIDNVTVYTFLFPIASLHPEAPAKSDAIWCSKDQVSAYKKAMKTGNAPSNVSRCTSPVARNIELASRAGVMGTPTIFFANGEKAAGALDVAGIERHFSTK